MSNNLLKTAAASRNIKAMSKQTKKYPGRKLSERIVKQITDYADRHAGFYARLADELTRLSNLRSVPETDRKEWSSESVSRIFTKNAERRVEVAWGTGLLIQKAFANCKQRDDWIERDAKREEAKACQL